MDPLARAVRHRLRREHGIEAGVPVLLSTEKPRCALVPGQGGNLLDYQARGHFGLGASSGCLPAPLRQSSCRLLW